MLNAESVSKKTANLVISNYHKHRTIVQKETYRMAYSIYIYILVFSAIAGFVYNVYAVRVWQMTVFHLLGCCVSAWLANYMPEWMIWVSCFCMIVSIIMAAVVLYRVGSSKTKRVYEEEVDFEDLDEELQEYIKSNVHFL